MNPTIGIDYSQWKQAARELYETSSRSCVDFPNGQALRVVIEAIRQTEKASKAEIERILGAVGRSVSFKAIKRGKNAGKTRVVRGGYVTKDQESFAHRILIARRVKTGKWGVKGESLNDKVSNFIRARVAAVNFIVAGWIPARNRLFSAVKNKAGIATTVAGVKQRGREKGSAKPAVFSLRSKIQVEIENRALMQFVKREPSTGGDPMPVAQRGLQKALNIAAADMMKKLAERLDPDFKKVSKR